jgi:hypothetical protein
MEADNIQILLVVAQVALIVITGAYVLLTRRIALAAQESARVSSDVLGEMRQQRLDASLPLVDCSITHHRRVGAIPSAVDVTFINAGNGAAVGVTVGLTLDNVNYLPRGDSDIAKLSLLMPRGQNKLTGTFDLPKTGRPDESCEGRIIADYRDIYGRGLRSLIPVKFSSDKVDAPWTLGPVSFEERPAGVSKPLLTDKGSANGDLATAPRPSPGQEV